MPLSVKCVVIVCVFVAQLCRASYVTINSYRLDPETDRSFFKTGTLRVAKKSRNLVVVSGTWELLQNMGEDVECVHSVFRKSELSGQYKKFMESKQAFCEYFNKDMIFLPKIREVSNVPEPGICPVPKGNYTVENYTYELHEALPMPPGDYLLIARFIKNGN